MKKLWYKTIIQISFFLLFFPLVSEASEIKVEPPFWWEQMEYNNLELLVYAENLAGLTPNIDNKDIKINSVFKPENKRYLFIDLTIGENVVKGFNLLLKNNKGKTIHTYWYELKERKENSRSREGFNTSDVVYLVMPDRFANGDPNNDNIEGMPELADREASSGRHGGDLKGITDNLDYIKDLGYTAIWLNPVLENNMPAYSYHGYAITDFYNVDARLGGNEAYLKFAEECDKRDIKVIKDMVFNHAGTSHWFIKDLPMDDWINQWPEFTRSNYHGNVNNDIYASEFDKTKMERGWFDKTMADMNQRNPYMLKYLIQNSIWWIEYAGLRGIRMDTHPYPEKHAMAEWANVIEETYPNFNIVAESWLNHTVHTAYWQKNAHTPDGYNSYVKSITDFPTYNAVKQGIAEDKEGWEEGLARIYFNMSQDQVYPDPQNLLVFPDNHDLQRIASSLDGDFNKFKLLMAFYATVRGIPQVYYGTEIMMQEEPYKDHGSWRRDYPGGWEGDTKNAFTGEGLSETELAAQTYVKKLLNWRKGKSVIHTGGTMHFIPKDTTYVYCRYAESERVVVILNKNAVNYTLKLDRFAEILDGYSSAFDVISEKEIKLENEIELTPMTPMILELRK